MFKQYKEGRVTFVSLLLILFPCTPQADVTTVIDHNYVLKYRKICNIFKYIKDSILKVYIYH